MDPQSLPTTRLELAQFVQGLAQASEGTDEAWENTTLRSYLDGMSGWIEDMDGYFQGLGEEVPDHPTWSLIAMILLAARSYE
ncbi:DUF7660 family protein [Microlunatus speluncae]|uniref:DUF7660 family protein n=1 Tax=Microlunatus speluncae TaxID=2594267 RepID=UPI0012661B20|nr:hypothetical protein [Microlunatus speluncae]